jgi:hypothetical protein
MHFEPTEMRISIQKLLVASVLLIVPLSIIGLYITNRTDRGLEQTTGERQLAAAQSATTIINRFTNDRVTDCRLIATAPSVLEAIAASNKSYKGLTDAAARDRIERLRKNWNATEPDPALKAILASPASRMLRQYRDIDPRYLRIIVSDQRGAAIAATGKPADYLQSEESYWPEVYAGGRGAVTIRNVLYDDSTHSNYIGVSVPVVDPETLEFTGSVYALVDISGLLQQLAATEPRSDSTLIMVKNDGTVVLGPGITLANNLKSEEYPAVRDAMASATGRQAGYTTADLTHSGRNIVSFSEAGTGTDKRSLNLIVMVRQSIRAATAEMRAIETFALVMVVLGLALLTLTAVYVLLHRREEFEDLEPLGEDLVPRPRPA